MTDGVSVPELLGQLIKSIQEVKGQLDLYECSCRQCSWCRDAKVEAAERLWSGTLDTAEALTSASWYEREAAEERMIDESNN